MTRRLCSFALVLFLLSTLPVQAQTPNRNARGMSADRMQARMQQMHQQMMTHPMHRMGLMAYTLPALKDTLGLSDDQVAALTEMRDGLRAQHREMLDQMRTHRSEMQNLFAQSDAPDPATVRNHVMDMAKLRATQHANVYQVGHEMREVLNEAQQTMLAEMTADEHMRQMQTHMPASDIQSTLRDLAGGMMHGGMAMGMQPGRMHHRGHRGGMHHGGNDRGSDG